MPGIPGFKFSQGLGTGYLKCFVLFPSVVFRDLFFPPRAADTGNRTLLHRAQETFPVESAFVSTIVEPFLYRRDVLTQPEVKQQDR